MTFALFDVSILRASVAAASTTTARDDDDATLVARSRRGERAASEQLFRRHAPAVLRLCLRLIASRAEAEDVAQEALATALDQLDSLREPAAFSRWLAQIAVRQAHRHFRRRKIRRFLGLDRGADPAVLESLAREDCSIEARAELARIDAVLVTLSADERLAWMLRVVEGEQLESVAELCDCSLATAKRRISAAQMKIDRETHEPKERSR